MSMISEFKAFAMRGNVIDLAVGVVIGAAFGKIVSSLVDGVIMPIHASDQTLSEMPLPDPVHDHSGRQWMLRDPVGQLPASAASCRRNGLTSKLRQPAAGDFLARLFGIALHLYPHMMWLPLDDGKCCGDHWRGADFIALPDQSNPISNRRAPFAEQLTGRSSLLFGPVRQMLDRIGDPVQPRRGVGICHLCCETHFSVDGTDPGDNDWSLRTGMHKERARCEFCPDLHRLVGLIHKHGGRVPASPELQCRLLLVPIAKFIQKRGLRLPVQKAPAGICAGGNRCAAFGRGRGRVAERIILDQAIQQIFRRPVTHRTGQLADRPFEQCGIRTVIAARQDHELQDIPRSDGNLFQARL